MKHLRKPVALLALPLLLFGFTYGWFYNRMNTPDTFSPPTEINLPMPDYFPELLPESYEQLWQRVDSLESKGLPESALKIVNTIYEKASAENNPSQLVKSLMHIAKYTVQVEDEGLVMCITRFRTEIEKSKSPDYKALLQSVLAEVFWRYYSENSWEFADRTETAEFNNADIATWDLKTLRREIVTLALESVKNEALAAFPTEQYREILVSFRGKNDLAANLLDLLRYRAIEILGYSNGITSEAINAFIPTEPKLLGSTSEFLSVKLGTNDSLSSSWNILQLYQKIISTKDPQTNPEHFIYADALRLHYVYDAGVMDNKDNLYLTALSALEKRFPTSSAIVLPMLMRAQYFYQLGQNPDNATNKDYTQSLVTARKICEEAINKFPVSDYKSNCENLITTILHPNLAFNSERFTLPGEDFLLGLEYSNLSKVYLRLSRVDENTMLEIENKYEDERLKAMMKTVEVARWEQAVPDPADHMTHIAHLPVKGLPMGRYLLMVCENPEFGGKKYAVAYTNFFVTELACITSTDQKGVQNDEVYVMNRKTGNPLSGVQVNINKEEYDYSKNRYVWSTIATYKTDAEGKAIVPMPKSGSRYYYIELVNGKDRVKFQDYHSQYPRDNNRSNELVHQFFTDRAIYRPGQTIYFKGLVMERTPSGFHQIKAGYPTTVFFYDANSQEIAHVEVTSNQFGSYSGKFVAPLGVLPGLMSIGTDYSTTYFRVEEYKRPKFEVNFEPVKGSFRLNENVIVKGKAAAYAGSNVDGAKVSYRVVRNVRWPWWWWGYYRYSSKQVSKEIAFGETKTDENGGFSITFPAVPDLSVDMKDDPTFTYTVYADVVDISGETRSSEVSVSVGRSSLVASVTLENEIDRNAFNQLRVVTMNQNGQKENASGKIKITRLNDPGKLYRNAHLQTPDQWVMTKAEFESRFPLDIYHRENDPQSWSKGTEVFSASFNTGKSDSVPVSGATSWAPGMYVMELESQDAFGQPVTWKKIFTLRDKNSQAVPGNQFFWVDSGRGSVKVGEKARIQFGTPLPSGMALFEASYNEKVIAKKWIKLSGTIHTEEILVTEDMRGGISWSVSFVANNRSYYHHNQRIFVPWDNKELKVEFETFRDKLAPGAQETWKVKIKGPQGEKVAAEMLAGMYDASLDAFAQSNWALNVWPGQYGRYNWNAGSQFYAAGSSQVSSDWYNNFGGYSLPAPCRLNWFGFDYSWSRRYYRGMYKNAEVSGEFDSLDGSVMMELEEGQNAPLPAAAKPRDDDKFAKDMEGGEIIEKLQVGNASLKSGEGRSGGGEPMKVRTNLSELAFFYPQLQTDAEGNIIFTFTVPEALTRWNFRALAWTTDLKVGALGKSTVTQKELMVMPNVPRFLRENDKFTFSTKISNLSEGDLSGMATLELMDATTGKPVDVNFANNSGTKNFSAKKGQSAAVTWDLSIPEGIQAVTWRVKASAGNFTDGEESTLPVLTNRMLVTEAMPLPMRPLQSASFKFDKLISSGNSSTLKHHALTLEFTSNPAWYAVQALPYLMEYPYECNEQTFSRFYANSLAAHIANSHPRIKQVFDQWAAKGNEQALLSNLEKNQELKYLLLEETPWVLQSKDEGERKRRVALLFEINKLAAEMDRALTKLEQAQVSNGAWPWFKGGPDDRYMTQHIITGMGKLRKLGVRDVTENARTRRMVKNGVEYLDRKMVEDYLWLKKNADDMNKNHTGYTQIQYLYMRSFWMDLEPLPNGAKEAYDYYFGQIKKYWLENGRYMQGMISVILQRSNEQALGQDILRSLKENSMKSQELGMFWKENTGGYFWWQAPIEFQAMMIEAFDESGKNAADVEELKLWLLKNKQTNDWKTTRATVEACYALLLRGTDFLAQSEIAEIKIGGQVIDPSSMPEVKVEAGTGYFKTSWKGEDVKPQMGNVEVKNKNQVAAWGAVYWQYFEQLDKITFAETPISIKKQLFLQKNTETGPVISPVSDKTELHPGDLLKVRIEIRVDRDLEYVHMKDMRASGFEPVNVLSQYKWQGGLGYYESTRDAATNFFFHWLPKGTWVFEYPLRVSHSGNFSNGITTIQCMYAPEFTSHSEGIRVTVK